MRRFLSAGILSLSCLMAAPVAAIAQSISLNLAGGLALPTGSFGDINDAGYTLAAGLGMGAPAMPLRFRAEVMFDEFNHKSPISGTSRAAGVTGNAIYDFSVAPGGPLTPYAIGGIGFYSTRVANGASSDTNLGWNLGGGLRIPLSGFSTYVEARYHSVSSVSVAFLPIVFGISF